MKVYLAGAIEHAPDSGKAWRDNVSAFLKMELGHDCYNPLIEEKKYLSQEESEKFRSLKTTDLNRFKRIVRKLMRGDLKSINNEIDYVICFWDSYAVKGGGTYGELTFAFYNNVPVYMVTKEDISEISAWVLSCTANIFSNFEDLKKFLRERYLPSSG